MQRGRCPLCGQLLLHAEVEPQHPDEWEQWITATAKAIRHQAIIVDSGPESLGYTAFRLIHSHTLPRPSPRPHRRVPCRRSRFGVLRDLTRARTTITRARTKEIQRLEKPLEDAGIKLSAVASNIVGVSGRAMLEALIGGQRDPVVLADLAKQRLAFSSEKIPASTEALRGPFSDHHAFMARLYLDRIDAHGADIARLEERIEEAIKPFQPAGIADEYPRLFPHRRRCVYRRDRRGHERVSHRCPFGVVGRGGARLQRIGGPAQIGHHPPRQPPPQSRSRGGRAVGSAFQRHLLQRPLPPHRRHPPARHIPTAAKLAARRCPP
ncbi:putative transposase [Mycobacterium kansasii 732]|nr:putative transposase [Mycobacterium kansasii 732]